MREKQPCDCGGTQNKKHLISSFRVYFLFVFMFLLYFLWIFATYTLNKVYLWVEKAEGYRKIEILCLLGYQYLLSYRCTFKCRTDGRIKLAEITFWMLYKCEVTETSIEAQAHLLHIQISVIRSEPVLKIKIVNIFWVLNLPCCERRSLSVPLSQMYL
jgi:hypothetical protein